MQAGAAQSLLALASAQHALQQPQQQPQHVCASAGFGSMLSGHPPTVTEEEVRILVEAGFARDWSIAALSTIVSFFACFRSSCLYKCVVFCFVLSGYVIYLFCVFCLQGGLTATLEWIAATGCSPQDQRM